MRRSEVGRSSVLSREGQVSRVAGVQRAKDRVSPPHGQGLGCGALWLGPGAWGAGKRGEQGCGD